VAGHANDAFATLMPPGPGREELQKGVQVISRMMTAAGLTSVTDAECSPAYYTAYQDALHAGEMRFRVYAMPQGYAPVFAHLRDAGIYTGLGDEWLKIGAAKWVADGSAQERTMRMSTPFADRPNDYGILYMEQDALDAAVEDAHRHRFQIGIHANGDVTIDMVLKAYERAQRLFPRPDPRFRIEHCSLVNEDLLRRIKAIGAIPTPFYTYVHYHGNNWVAYGEEKMRSMFAHRSFLDHGIPVAPASDYIPGPFEPLMALQSMVTRKDYAGRVWGANQRITLDEALRICTMGGAYASFEEGTKGSITAGKLGDFVILERDPHDVDPDAIETIAVVRTVVGGRTVHSL
jgi:predicted amidohydrolase YtcJ